MLMLMNLVLIKPSDTFVVFVNINRSADSVCTPNGIQLRYIATETLWAKPLEQIDYNIDYNID